jgi:hypothetical protein
MPIGVMAAWSLPQRKGRKYSLFHHIKVNKNCLPKLCGWVDMKVIEAAFGSQLAVMFEHGNFTGAPHR